MRGGSGGEEAAAARKRCGADCSLKCTPCHFHGGLLELPLRGGFIFTFRHRNECKREVGSDPRAGYFFQRSSVPPRADCVRKLERGGATILNLKLRAERVLRGSAVNL